MCQEVNKQNKRKTTRILLLGTFLMSFVGCSAFDRHDSSTIRGQGPTKSSEQTAAFDEKNNEDQSEVTSVYERTQSKKVAVILGPGGYKAFAHAGVIKELRKKNVPIDAIVGMEWGALVAGLYSQRAQVNEAEWKLYKLEKLNLNSGGFFSRKKETQNIHDLDKYLEENLNVSEVGQTAVPFFCPSLMLNQGALKWQDEGRLWQAVSNCLSFPPLFYPSKSQVVAGLFSLDEVILKIKKAGYNFIIFVNVLGEGNLFENSMLKDDYPTAMLWNEVRRNLWQARRHIAETINVNTRGIGLSDFESRKILVSVGETAGEKAAKMIADKYGF